MTRENVYTIRPMRYVRPAAGTYKRLSRFFDECAPARARETRGVNAINSRSAFIVTRGTIGTLEISSPTPDAYREGSDGPFLFPPARSLFDGPGRGL